MDISCKTCRALCCHLEVALIDDSDDQVPLAYVETDSFGRMTMKRHENGPCIALDQKTFLCTIYELRPFLCRDYQAGDYDCLEERKKLN